MNLGDRRSAPPMPSGRLRALVSFADSRAEGPSASHRTLIRRALAIVLFAAFAAFGARGEALVTLLLATAGLVYATVSLLAEDRAAQLDGEAGSTERRHSPCTRGPRPPSTAERARAYGRLMSTLSSLESQGLLKSERERICRAADELVFCSDLAADRSARDALKDVAAQADALRTSSRLSGEAARRLLADLAACGPSPPRTRR